VQLYGHIIGIYRRMGERGKEGGGEKGGKREGEKKGEGEKKCKEAKAK